MAETTWYSQGAFCWAECSTSDLEGAKAFYAKVFNWEVEETPIPGGVYVQFKRNGKSVAAAAEQQEQEKTQGIPPHWNVYIAVDDADTVSKEAEQLGATILAPAFDVLESGRMAVVADPTGGAIGFWQAKDHIGAEVYAEENAMTWWELMTPDPKRATEFYTSLFGYETEMQDTSTGPYVVLKHKGENAAGIMAPPAGTPPIWTPYVHVADADATLTAATAAGAETLMRVTEGKGIGRLSWIKDPQGAIIAFIQPAPREDTA
jgi:predicted enzyme related to lactoylglutathione lyase